MQEAQVYDPKFDSFEAGPVLNAVGQTEIEYVRVYFPKTKTESAITQHIPLHVFTPIQRTREAEIRAQTDPNNESNVFSAIADVLTADVDYRKMKNFKRPFERLNPDTTYRLVTDPKNHTTRYEPIIKDNKRSAVTETRKVEAAKQPELKEFIETATLTGAEQLKKNK